MATPKVPPFAQLRAVGNAYPNYNPDRIAELAAAGYVTPLELGRYLFTHDRWLFEAISADNVARERVNACDAAMEAVARWAEHAGAARGALHVAIRDAYANGASLRQIADVAGVSHTTVRNILGDG